MKTPSDEFREQLVNLDKEELADIQRQIDEGTYEFPEVEWLDDPDPFGLDWRWLYGPRREDVPPQKAVTKPAVEQPAPPAAERTAWRASLAAGLAASLLVGLLAGWLAFGRGVGLQDMQLLAADASVQFGPPRGGEPQPSVLVEAPFVGFATVVGLAPDRKQQVIPVAGGADIPVPEEGPSQPVPLRSDTTHVVYFVTPTPAAEAVRRELDAPTAPRYSPEDAEELVTRIQDILAEKGHRRIASGSRVVEQQP